MGDLIMPYIKLTDIDEFNAWHESIMKELGIPDGLGTVIYSEIYVHPENGMVAASIDERVDTSNYEVLTNDDLFEQGYLEYPQAPNPFV
jgi:hypothetical protein